MPAINNDTGVQTELPAPIKTFKKYQDKVDKTEALKKEKEQNKTTGNEQRQVRCPSCGGADHSRSSSKYPKFVTLIQEVVDHITQLVYAESIFANYYFLKLLDNGEELFVVTQNLLYNIFSIFAGQGKYASDSIKKSFKTFCESTFLIQSDLDKCTSKGYMTIVSSMEK
ncbi:hypothetical protein G6F70_009253 [Rhizopus microsporus]|nr:hypothetical protein G6F71_008892 [Rhizopus microsporus]KAG1192031.1 hypothetical protein G6F70_009253 [Rhizopus microsporus]KAG1205839.1 hypothetical protein G6F69_009234 [Rhizopus microsporus]KAG1225649.1 hypothetical protein G6F67_009246 [Rhizopus microsporus]KAG1256565.1 hypothetical protein G6F68_009723 [Rhizopus microsporus]